MATRRNRIPCEEVAIRSLDRARGGLRDVLKAVGELDSWDRASLWRQPEFVRRMDEINALIAQAHAERARKRDA
jgi:hypothetical protein